MSAKVRCIIVGVGNITATMLKFLTQQPWYETAGVVDVRAEALTRARETLGLPASALYTRLDDALRDAGAAVALINTPSELHYAQSKAALEAGLHVLVAKPITNNFEQAVELVKLAQAQNLTLCVGQQMRYNRHYQAVQRFVDAGRLGSVEAVFFMNSKPRPNPANLAKMDQPALYEFACHHFDSIMGVVGADMPEWIMCDGFIPSWSRYVGPCMVNALIRFSGGLHVMYHGGFSAQSDMYEFRLEGSAGVLRCHGIHMSNDAMRYEFAPALGKFEPAAIDAEVPLRSPWLPVLDLWYDYLHGGPEPSFSGRHNLPVFALLSAAIDAMNTGRPVDVAANPRFAAAF